MSPPSLDKENNENPYAAPIANLHEGGDGNQAGFNPDGKTVGTDLVMGWYGRALEMFKANALMWILMVIVFLVVNTVVAFIPLINLVGNILFPVFIGGFMLGCMAIARGEPLRIEHLFDGFQKHFVPLALVGLLYLAALIVVGIVCGIGMLIVGMGSFGAFLAGGKTGLASAMLTGGMGIMLIFLVAMALMIPVAMAIWFAPLLVVAHQMTPIDAMKASFSGCMKNMLPFLLYGILYIVFAIVASIPLLLGWLVLGPVLIATIYTSYEDIYLTRS